MNDIGHNSMTFIKLIIHFDLIISIIYIFNVNIVIFFNTKV